MDNILLTSPLWSIFLFSLIPLTLKVLNNNKEQNIFISSGLALVGLLTSLGLLFFIWPSAGSVDQSIFSSALILNNIRALASVLLIFVGIFIILMSLQHPQINKQRFSEILFLKLGSIIGLFILLWSGNLLTAFIGLELASLAFYLLIAMGDTGSSALKASFKYFILGSVASAILLYGISFVLGSVGHFDLQKIFQQSPELINNSRLLAVALVFIFVGFLFKVSIFPFQFWLLDVYRGSATPLLVLMATGLKLTIFILLFEWTKNIFTVIQESAFLSVLQWFAILSVLFGNIIALLQKDFKKLLLFSTIAHSGYLLMILIASQKGFYIGQTALFYYLSMYICMTLGVFICLRPFETKNNIDISLENFKNLAHHQPMHAFLITIFLLSLAGIPPTGGFIAKLFVFQGLIDQQLWWLLGVTIISSTIALFYYLKPIAFMYMYKNSEIEEQSFYCSHLLTILMIILVGIIMIGGLMPSVFTFI